MLLDREARLASRCSFSWRVVSAAAVVLAVALLAGALGVQPAQAQETQAAAEEAVAEETAAVAEESVAEETAEEEKVARFKGEVITPDVRITNLLAELAESRAKVAQLAAEQDRLKALVEKAATESHVKAQLIEALQRQYGSEHPTVKLLQQQKNLLAEQLAGWHRQLAGSTEKSAEVQSRLAEAVAESRTKDAAATAQALKAFDDALKAIEPEDVAAEAKGRQGLTPQEALGLWLDGFGVSRQKAARQKAVAEQLKALAAQRAAAQAAQAAERVAAQAVEDDALAAQGDVAWERAPAQYRSPVGEQRGMEAVPFDLVNLATAYIDALGDLERAEKSYARIEGLRKAKAVSNEEADNAAINLRTAERKVALLDRITRSAIKATHVEVGALIGQLEELKERTAKSPGRIERMEIELARAQSRLEILESIASSR